MRSCQLAANASKAPAARFAAWLLLVAPCIAFGAPRLELPGLDRAKALQEDAANADRPGPLRYAIGHAVDAGVAVADPVRGGAWTRAKNGDWTWTLDVRAPGARTLDFGFSRYRLPYGAQLWLTGLNSGHVQGPFDDRHNQPGGQFWTPVVADELVRIELRVPADKREFLQLQLGTVHQGYRSVFGLDDGVKSGACNVDVVCPEGDGWRSQINSVAAISMSTSGTRDGVTCTGQFVNSTGTPGDPLFLSANHCRLTPENAASTVAYFNFQNSTCRTRGSASNGQNGNGPLNTFVSGASLLAQAAAATDSIYGSDFVLLRFNSAPPGNANVYYSGWDRSAAPPSAGTGIHHPNGDEKRISFDYGPLTISAYTDAAGRPTDTHLRVAAWDIGTTEPGSSGSGLWNPAGRLVGVLSGGFAACTGGSAEDNDLPDYYGRLAHAWAADPAPNRRLSNWLDPANTGATVLDGRASAPQLQVVLESTAFATAPTAGARVAFTASASGTSGAVTYEWDVDGDRIIDRRGSESRIEIVYPRQVSTQVYVRVSDAAGNSGELSRALDVRGGRLTAEAAGAPTQVCGDNDATIDPGERWQLPVRLTNAGNAEQPAATALFAAGDRSAGGLPIGPNTFGYRAETGCAAAAIDIATGANAVPALPTSVFNDNPYGPLDDARTTSPIALGGSGFALYGQRYTQAVMSTNGYLSFSNDESGADFSNSCDGAFGNGAAGPQLRPFHDDLVVSGLPQAGLRYRYFASCPRTAEAGALTQGCHVFQWSRMQIYDENQAEGDFNFQAIAYEASGQIVYQYIGAAPNEGGTATIGIIDQNGDDPLVVSCNDRGAPANSATCIYAPDAQPASPLRLPAATVAVPALAAGSTTTVSLPFSLERNARCGTAFDVDYIAAAANDGATHSSARATVLQDSIGALCQAVDNCAVEGAAIDVRQGLYASPARPGNGVANFVYPQGANRSLFGGAWYTALPDRTPTWYTAQGVIADNAGRVPLLRYVNAGAPGGFDPVSEQIGQAWVAQLDADSLLLAWQLDDGRTGAERMDAQPFPFQQPNHTQTWYAPAEPGWGLAIESLNAGSPLEFLGAYVYDATGTARWVVGSRGDVAGGTFSLIGYRPHCPGCPWFVDVLDRPQAAGTLTIDYGSRSSATLDTQITLPAPLSGSWNRTEAQIAPLGEPQP